MGPCEDHEQPRASKASRSRAPPCSHRAVSGPCRRGAWQGRCYTWSSQLHRARRWWQGHVCCPAFSSLAPTLCAPCRWVWCCRAGPGPGLCVKPGEMQSLAPPPSPVRGSVLFIWGPCGLLCLLHLLCPSLHHHQCKSQQGATHPASAGHWEHWWLSSDCPRHHSPPKQSSP